MNVVHWRVPMNTALLRKRFLQPASVAENPLKLVCHSYCSQRKETLGLTMRSRAGAGGDALRPLRAPAEHIPL